jgi:hypothetical protein
MDWDGMSYLELFTELLQIHRLDRDDALGFLYEALVVRCKQMAGECDTRVARRAARQHGQGQAGGGGGGALPPPPQTVSIFVLLAFVLPCACPSRRSQSSPDQSPIQ